MDEHEEEPRGSEVFGAPPFEELDHTADLALRVRGEGLGALFVHAAQGMFHLMRCEVVEGAESVSRHISLEAPDLETLLVEWLNELLYVSESNGECYEQFRVRYLDRNNVRADIIGRPYRVLARNIKAATYSNLHVTETAEGYEATITFDV